MRPRSTKRTLASLVLAAESLVIFFGTLTAFGMKFADGGSVWAVGLSLSVLAIITPGFLRVSFGYVIGWLIQVAILVLSIWSMVVNPVGVLLLIMGIVVIGMWLWAMIAGSTIDAARVAWEKANGVPESTEVFRIDAKESK